MALLDVNLGSSDRTIDDSNANDGDTIRVTALGSQTLTVDGVDVTVTQLLNAQLGSAPTFSAINGANLTFAGGLGDISALNAITYRIGGTSRIEVNGSLLNANLSQQTIEFEDDTDGRFTYDPSGLGLLGIGAARFDVVGIEPGDQLAVDGRTNLNFSYNDTTGEATLSSSGGLLGQSVFYNFAIDEERANLVLNNRADYIENGVFTFPSLNVPCFAAGTRIIAEQGSMRIEALKVGDRVLTMDRGFRRILWHGMTRKYVTGPLRPIRIRKGVLRNSRDLVVSPQHKILMSTEAAMGAFPETHMLVAAKYLLDREGITQDPPGIVEYHHILFEQHEIIYSEGIPTESFHPGEVGMSALDTRAREELFSIFPEIAVPGALDRIAAARSVAKRHEGRLLANCLKHEPHETRDADLPTGWQS